MLFLEKLRGEPETKHILKMPIKGDQDRSCFHRVIGYPYIVDGYRRSSHFQLMVDLPENFCRLC